MGEASTNSSPKWNNMTKLVVSLVFLVIAGALIVKFKYLIGPLMLAFVISYLIYPLAQRIQSKTKIPWKLAVTILYILLLLIVVGLLTWGGISIANGFQSFINFLQNFLNNLPSWLENLSKQSFLIGPFALDLSFLDISNLWTEIQKQLQPILTKSANLVGGVASGAASVVTWAFFTFLVSYFFTAETAGSQRKLINLKIPGYQDDFNKLGHQLSQIWKSFLRGQLIVLLVAISWYTILLGGLGINYFFWMALLAGLARFVPYVGPFILYVIYFLVAVFQSGNIFNITPFAFALVVIGCSLLSDMIIDNFVSTRVMSNALKVHPAAVLVTVLISASLFGFFGMLLAAPVLASIKLFVTYAMRKLMDQDPWEGLETYPKPAPLKDQLLGIYKKILVFLSRIFGWGKKTFLKFKQWVQQHLVSHKSKEI